MAVVVLEEGMTETQSQQEVQTHPQRKSGESNCLLMTSCIANKRTEMMNGADKRRKLAAQRRFCGEERREKREERGGERRKERGEVS